MRPIAESIGQEALVHRAGQVAILLARLLVLVGIAALFVACTGAGNPPPDGASASGAEGCGPPEFAEIRGRAPSYLPQTLDASPNDHALCAGLWLPRTSGPAFVPQGLAIRGRTAWISGYDDGEFGSLYCRVLRVDLRTGRLLDERGPVTGNLTADLTADPTGSAAGREVTCRHGGGLVRDEQGLWLAEKGNLWLLDPESLTTLRVWALTLPVWGSALVHDDRGRLGLIGYAASRPTRVHWFRPSDLATSPGSEITAGDALRVSSAPPRTQGAVYIDDPDRPAASAGGPRLWFVRSTTTCGVLEAEGHEGRSVGFLPGAEGATLAGGSLWVLSESTSAPYWRRGGRPVVPQLARYDLGRGTADWETSACTP